MNSLRCARRISIAARPRKLPAGSAIYVVVTLPAFILAAFGGNFAATARAEARTGGTAFTQDARAHWAFQPIIRPRVPDVKDVHSLRSSIDAFILSRLEQEGISFAPPAGKRDLIRRATYDLLALPTTPGEIAAFVADDRADAYDRLIEVLLADPHYGEAEARLWLDLVRFAETAGFNADPSRPLAYKYRDYVIDAFNADLSYDRFIAEQIAGDELFPDRSEALVATGFNRMWPDESNASNILKSRQESLNDLTANLGAVLLGLSLGCAQCHDHKFDPVSQKDFYRLQAFFSGIVLEDHVVLGTNEQLHEYKTKLNRWHAQSAALRDELCRLEHDARVKVSIERRNKFPDVVLTAIDALPHERTEYQRQLAFWSERQIDVDEKKMIEALTTERRERRAELIRQLTAIESSRPNPPDAANIMATIEIERVPPAVHVLDVGSYDSPLDEVQPGFPEVLCAVGKCDAQVTPPRPDSSGRRTALAAWLTDPKNPLVARVMVNRIWQQHMGRGLVENANDFGTRTPAPEYRELLDWLADEFITSGYSVKHLHRLIMNSAVYRQGAPRQSDKSSDLAGTGEHGAILEKRVKLFGCGLRRRLSAEQIRDSLLAASGRLNTQMHGPGVRPALPPGYSGREKWAASENTADHDRRSVYIYAKRNLPYPLLDAFDFPDMHESCAQRVQTVTAPQALMLLNNEVVLEAAGRFADRVLAESSTDAPGGWVSRAYLIAFGRPAEDDERLEGIEFIARQQALVSSTNRGENEQPAGEKKTFDARHAALSDFCHALLNANEFLYIE